MFLCKFSWVISKTPFSHMKFIKFITDTHTFNISINKDLSKPFHQSHSRKIIAFVFNWFSFIIDFKKKRNKKKFNIYQTLWSISPKKRFTWFTRDGIKIVTQSPISTYSTIFVFLVLTALYDIRVSWELPLFNWWIVVGYWLHTVWIFKAEKFHPKSSISFEIVLYKMNDYFRNKMNYNLQKFTIWDITRDMNGTFFVILLINL